MTFSGHCGQATSVRNLLMTCSGHLNKSLAYVVFGIKQVILYLLSLSCSYHLALIYNDFFIDINFIYFKLYIYFF
jgi:hypothetical protein